MRFWGNEQVKGDRLISYINPTVIERQEFYSVSITARM